MTRLKVCSRHGLFEPGNPSTPGGRCPLCYKAANQRRAAKQRAAGRTTAAWRKRKQAAKEAAGHRCQLCGRLEQPTPAGWLDVHLADRSHSHADPMAPLIVVCKACHGAHHAPEATRRQ